MSQTTAIKTLQFSDGILSEIADAVKNTGVVKVQGCVTAEELVELNKEFDDILAAKEDWIINLGIEGGEARNVHRLQITDSRFPRMAKLFASPWMSELSQMYWGDERILNEHIFVTKEIPGTKHLAQDLHFDVQDTLKFFLYLNDVTRVNGAFSCVPGSISHTKKTREEKGAELSYTNREYSRQHPYSEEDVEPVEGPAGTLIVFTTEVWHRAGLVSSGERRVMRGHTRTPVITEAPKPSKPKDAEVKVKASKPKKEPKPKKGLRGFIQRLFKR